MGKENYKKITGGKKLEDVLNFEALKFVCAVFFMVQFIFGDLYFLMLCTYLNFKSCVRFREKGVKEGEKIEIFEIQKL